MPGGIIRCKDEARFTGRDGSEKPLFTHYVLSADDYCWVSAPDRAGVSRNTGK